MPILGYVGIRDWPNRHIASLMSGLCFRGVGRSWVDCPYETNIICYQVLMVFSTYTVLTDSWVSLICCILYHRTATTLDWLFIMYNTYVLFRGQCNMKSLIHLALLLPRKTFDSKWIQKRGWVWQNVTNLTLSSVLYQHSPKYTYTWMLQWSPSNFKIIKVGIILILD